MKIGKADLIDVIEAAYRAGYGPGTVAKITGYSLRTIHVYAREMGLFLGTSRPRPPIDPPVPFLVVLAKVGLARASIHLCNPSRRVKA